MFLVFFFFSSAGFLKAKTLLEVNLHIKLGGKKPSILGERIPGRVLTQRHMRKDRPGTTGYNK